MLVKSIAITIAILGGKSIAMFFVIYWISSLDLTHTTFNVNCREYVAYVVLYQGTSTSII